MPLSVILKWANPGLFFVYFNSFLITILIQIEKSVDGVLGIRAWGHRMVSADETTELWRPPCRSVLNKQISSTHHLFLLFTLSSIIHTLIGRIGCICKLALFSRLLYDSLFNFLLWRRINWQIYAVII